MAAPYRITDHVRAGLDLLIEQYKDKPRLAGLLTSYLNRAQELEDATWEVLVDRPIDEAEGVQLDTLGKLVGQPRTTADDEVYRLRIRTRIRANRSLGNPEDIIAVATSALDGSPLLYDEYYPASFVVEAREPLGEGLAPVVFEFLELAKAIGTEASFHFSSDEEPDTFAFSDSDESEEDEARGFSGDDGSMGPGGALIGAF
jgi:hypothetical protein